MLKVDYLQVKNYSSDKENKRHFIDNNMGQRHKITNYSSSSNDHHTEVQRGNRTACKRKVLRRREGEARVFDESFAESDTGWCALQANCFIIKTLTSRYLKKS